MDREGQTLTVRWEERARSLRDDKRKLRRVAPEGGCVYIRRYTETPTRASTTKQEEQA